MERKDKTTARAMGIRATQEFRPVESVFGDPLLHGICKGRSHQGIKMLIGSWVDGWKLQDDLEREPAARTAARTGQISK